MIKKTILILLTVCQAFAVTAQKKGPKWLDNATKAIFSIETVSKEGITKTGAGFFISENGEAVAASEVFKKADKAFVITEAGQRLPVTHLLGIDDMYGVIRFKVAAPKKINFLPVANVAPIVQSIVYLPPVKGEKELAQGAVSGISKISSVYDYFKITMPLPPSQIGYPLLNEVGEVFALSQADASGKGNTYGVAIAYIQNLQSSLTDILGKKTSETSIRQAWPSDVEDAHVALILYSSLQDAATYLETLNDFIASFSNYDEGYISRASHYTHKRKELASTEQEQRLLLDKAWNDLETAAKIAKKKGNGFYNKAKLVFSAIVGDSTLAYKNWDLKTAEDLIIRAIKEEDLPVYHLLQGELAMFQKDFEKAYLSYEIVNQSPEASGSSFYYAAKCKQQLEGTNTFEIVTLLDSAINRGRPDEIPVYLLEAIDLKTQLGLYELVIKDYDRYFIASNFNVSDVFYYYREQAKFKTGDLEGALSDIEMAIVLDNTNAIYFAEKAAICLRQNNIPKAQESVEKAIVLDPEFASAYRILGVCLIRQEKAKDACVHFEKAKELGDPVVERLINENCKN